MPHPGPCMHTHMTETLNVTLTSEALELHLNGQKTLPLNLLMTFQEEKLK